MAGVSLEGVSKVFPGNVAAVRQLSLHVADQEFCVLVGPSGCGKSTTLRLIAGLEEVTEGTICIDGKIVNQTPPRDRNLAMVFQSYALYPHLNVYRNMAFGLELRQGSSWWWRTVCRWCWPSRSAELASRQKSIEERVRQTAQVLGIEPLLSRWPRQLSGGERQRVALGRAMVRQPAAFLFDEPLSNLDAQLRQEMRRELKQLHRRLRATMIYVTHDQVEALSLGDRIAVMSQGTIQQVGTPLEVYRQPRNRFVAGFIGSPPMNLLDGKLVKLETGLEFEVAGETLAVDPAKYKELALRAGFGVTLGIRPEELQVERGQLAMQKTVHEGGGRAHLAGTVTAVEMVGDAFLVQVEIGEKAVANSDLVPASSAASVVAKVVGPDAAAVGQKVKISFNLQKALWFDPVSGENLGLGRTLEGNWPTSPPQLGV